MKVCNFFLSFIVIWRALGITRAWRRYQITSHQGHGTIENKAKLFADYIIVCNYHETVFATLRLIHISMVVMSCPCHICVAFSMKMYNHWFLAWKFKLLFHNDFWGSLFIPVWNGSKSATASNRMKRPLDHMDGDPRGKSEGFTTNLGENVLFKSASFFLKTAKAITFYVAVRR